MPEEIKTNKEETKITKEKPKTNKEETKISKEKPKKAKPKAPKARKIGFLLEESTKKMTDKEKDLLIKYLRENETKLNNQIKALTDNLDSAYKKMHQIEDQYGSMEAYYRKNFNYINDQLTAFAAAIRRSTMEV